MCIEAVAKVPHHALADDVVQVGLPETQGSVDDGGRDHRSDDQQQELQAVVGGLVGRKNHVVEHDFDEQRVDEPDRRDYEDENADDCHLAAIRLERHCNPAERAGFGLAIRLLRGC